MNKQQLANKIWASANKMRSKIDASEYKDYILGLIFYKFLSDNEVSRLMAEGMSEDDIQGIVEDPNDPEQEEIKQFCLDSFGYYIEYKNLFSTWLKPEVPFTVADLNTALSAFERLVSPTYKHIYKDIFQTLQAGLSKLGTGATEQTKALKELIRLIKDIPTDSRQDYDVLGFVYEYLISNFAASAGKKAGEFYTPHEVAQLMSEIVADHHKAKDRIEIYDPTSGSGSLLITIGKAVSRHIQSKDSVKYYAQELKENTYNLTRMNLVMRGIQPANIVTRCADSLAEDWPIQEDGVLIGKPLYVDAVVSNPPYSQHWDPTDMKLDARFSEYGVAPKTKADYAFLLHELHHIKPDGLLTIVLPHGVLFRGDATKDADGEGKIRKNLIESNNIDAIIGLPASIFFGTPIPTIIMVLKKERKTDDVLIIDACKGFVKDGKQNKLRACDIRRIADVVRDRVSVPGFSKVVSRKEIRDNGYNLNIPRYVDSSDPAVKYDLYATMFGGIPNSELDEMQEVWTAFPTLRDDLFIPAADKPYSALKASVIAETMERNADVMAFQQQYALSFEGLSKQMHELLIGNMMQVNELTAQDQIAAEIFSRLENIPLVDRYAAYQSLADNWQTIANDIEILQSEGMDAARVVEDATKIVKKGDDEMEVACGRKGRIIPFELIQQTLLKKEADALRTKQMETEAVSSEIEEASSELDEEELLTYRKEESEDLDKKKICADAKDKKGDVEPETLVKLKKLATLWDKETKLKKEAKTMAADLLSHTETVISSLTDTQILELLDLKWIAPVCEAISALPVLRMKQIEEAISGIQQKYATTYSEIEQEMASSRDTLASLISELTGDEFAIQGLITFAESPIFLKQIKAASLQAMFPQEGETKPKVRFKGFEGEWKKKLLSDCLGVCNDKNTNLLYGKEDVLSVSDDFGVCNQISLLGRSYAGKSVANYGILKTGDVVYTKSPLKAKPFGIIKTNHGETGIVSTLYAIYSPLEGICSDFIEVYFDSAERMNRYIHPLVNKGAKNDMKVSSENALKGYVMIPSYEEQVQIAAYFSNLDKQIALQSQRLEKLKQIKSACLDNMFV